MEEECETIHEDGLYRVRTRWLKLLGLMEPAELTLNTRMKNSTMTLTIKLSETLFSNHLQLMEENKFLKGLLNSSKPEQETLGHKLESREADITTLKASLEAYEEKLFKEAEETKKLIKELSVMRFLTALLGLSTTFLFIILLKRKLTRIRSRMERVDENA